MFLHCVPWYIPIKWSCVGEQNNMLAGTTLKKMVDVYLFGTWLGLDLNLKLCLKF